MSKSTSIPTSDLLGMSRLAVGATTGVTEMVEALHYTILRAPGPVGAAAPGPMGGIPGLVYRSVRGITRLVGGGLDLLLGHIPSLAGERASSPERENLLAILNGVLGDHLEQTGNPLAIPMRWRQGRPPAIEEPRAKGRILLLVHGLCRHDRHWSPPPAAGETQSDAIPEAPMAALARELGYTPLALHYNSGRHISHNGRQLAALLEDLLDEWPAEVEELAIVAHSMGGLVARSAAHYGAAAGHRWPRRLRRLVFLGTPHHGSPLERGGNLVDALLGISPYSAPFSRLGKIRSAGITDLRYSCLLDEDWQGRDRFERAPDSRRRVPLPSGALVYAIAGKKGHPLAESLLGDGLVPVGSALGRHSDPELSLDLPESHTRLFDGIGHLELTHHPAVVEQVRLFLSMGLPATPAGAASRLGPCG